MPELPEVETIRLGLEARLVGARIAAVRVRPCRVFHCGARRLQRRLQGRTFRRFRRRGKFLAIELDDCHWIVHLGMTGQMTVRDPEQPDSPQFLRQPVTGLQRARQHAPDRHTHVEVHLEDGRSLLYRDPRKFGRHDLVESVDTGLKQYFAGLGLEPLSDEFTWEALGPRLRGRKTPVKAALLRQDLVAGVGNIYADEALFEARIHPANRIHRIPLYELRRLVDAIPAVLRHGVHFGGTTLRDYLNSDGEQGTNQDELLVYGRDGEPCFRCGGKIHKTVVAQRGTHFCPRCQRRR